MMIQEPHNFPPMVLKLGEFVRVMKGRKPTVLFFHSFVFRIDNLIPAVR